MKTEYEAVIGLEIHARLLTNTKIFCSCANSFGGTPNSQTCPVCLGMPGSLPVLNQEAVNLAVKTGRALKCSISPYTKFDRKNYFYPDLPKAYQISQYDKPVCLAGVLEIPGNGGLKPIRITRIHLEEDAGKLLHTSDDFSKAESSLVDYNRCGTPLMEIVTEPDISSPDESYEFLSELKKILLYLGVCDCNMEEGSLKCDANISIRPKGDTALGVKTELKNMNSFKNIRLGLQYEIGRQVNLLSSGEKIVQETRLWNADKGITQRMRGKEEAHDYRYFPEPDLPPVVIDDDTIEEISKSIPELPRQKKERFMCEYGLPEQDAVVLSSDRTLSDFFEETAQKVSSPKKASNWIMVDILSKINEDRISSVDQLGITPSHLSRLINLIEEGVISGKIAKEVFQVMCDTKKMPGIIVEEKGLKQVTDSNEIEEWVNETINQNPGEVTAYRSGKEKVLGFLVGQVMKKSRGKANPKLVNQLIKEKIKL